MKSRKFLSVPGGPFFSIIFMIGTLFCCWLILYAVYSGQGSPFVILFSVVWIIFCVVLTVKVAPYASCVVEILNDRIVCLIPFHQNVVIEFDKCYIGLDYHNQSGRKIWWIYLSYGKMPPYNNPQLGNRINSIKCQPGFVRIMYREEVCAALLKALPKRQRTALIAARRLAGFNDSNT